MPPALKKDEKEKTIKGKEAEDRVIGYLREMNRPFGSADVSANIKGVVSKAMTQKILTAAAERGEITQKTYGKATYFVAKQEDIITLPQEQLDETAKAVDRLNGENKELSAVSKSLLQEYNKIKSTPTDSELTNTIDQTRVQIENIQAILVPLRQGTPLITQDELDRMDTDWQRYRVEWVARKKLFRELWGTLTDSMSPTDSQDLADDLGIEYDTPQHLSLEQSPLCAPPPRKRY